MQVLPEGRYGAAAEAIADVSINCFFAKSVIDRHVKGKILVDNIERPKVFYVIHPYQMSLLFGDVNDAFLHNELKDYLLNKDGCRAQDESLQIFPHFLEEKIDNLLADSMWVYDHASEMETSQYGVIKHTRVNFAFNQTRFRDLLQTVDLKMFSFSQLDSHHFSSFKGNVVPGKFWDNADDFTTRGCGFVLHLNDVPAAVVFSSFIHDNYLELGMETRQAYRRKGLATVICAKQILYCLENGLEPVWSCRLGNVPSYKLALKLGFDPTKFLPYYELL